MKHCLKRVDPRRSLRAEIGLATGAIVLLV